MIKLKDLLLEKKMPRGLSLGKLQVFSPGTGGRLNLQPGKFPKGKLKVGSFMSCLNKPNGAFWTSSYKAKFKGSDWTDYKKKEFPHWHTGMGAVFELKGSPKIAKVTNQKQYDKLREKYPIDYTANECRYGDRYINWYKIAKDYDGFQLAVSSSQLKLFGAHQWDVESTAWFNMKKLKFIGTTKV